jgi:predicted DNA-binding transcriptional regulator AlpA
MPFVYGEPLLRADQVAEYLGLSVQTLYNMRLRGEGPVAYKFGGRSGPLRYHCADVEKWLAENREVGS